MTSPESGTWSVSGSRRPSRPIWDDRGRWGDRVVVLGAGHWPGPVVAHVGTDWQHFDRSPSPIPRAGREFAASPQSGWIGPIAVGTEYGNVAACTPRRSDRLDRFRDGWLATCPCPPHLSCAHKVPTISMPRLGKTVNAPDADLGRCPPELSTTAADAKIEQNPSPGDCSSRGTRSDQRDSIRVYSQSPVSGRRSIRLRRKEMGWTSGFPISTDRGCWSFPPGP